jgi:hypothetical protein
LKLFHKCHNPKSFNKKLERIKPNENGNMKIEGENEKMGIRKKKESSKGHGLTLDKLMAKDEKVGFIHLLDVYNIGR